MCVCVLVRVHACVRACVRVVFTCITTVMLANVVCIWPFPEPASVICNEGRMGTASNPYTSECLCVRFDFICIIYLFILLFLCLPNVFRSTSGRLERHLVARTYRTTPPRACTQRAKNDQLYGVITHNVRYYASYKCVNGGGLVTTFEDPTGGKHRVLVAIPPDGYSLTRST